jgi:ABC-type multidrug transport system ATPase subunit
MGPSGAGKSSFLSMITAKTSAYTSTFNFEGQVYFSVIQTTLNQ